MAAADAEHRRRAEQLGAGRERAPSAPASLVRPPRRAALGLRRRELDPDQVREGRVAQRPAALELAGEEAGGVVARRRGRCRRRPGPASGRSRRPPRSPRPLRPASWATSAKVRSSARKSGKRRVASASRTTLEDDLGEVVALGDHLGADEDARLAPRSKPARISSVGAAARRRCRSRAGRPASAPRASLEQRPRSARCRRRAGEGDRAAVGAGAGQRLGVGAVVAAKRARPRGGRPARRRSRGSSSRARRSGR